MGWSLNLLPSHSISSISPGPIFSPLHFGLSIVKTPYMITRADDSVGKRLTTFVKRLTSLKVRSRRLLKMSIMLDFMESITVSLFTYACPPFRVFLQDSSSLNLLTLKVGQAFSTIYGTPPSVAMQHDAAH